MNTKKQQWILYLITLTIVTTVAIQFYWNYKNYEENKRQVTNDIQLSLDNAVEEYYSSLAKTNFITIIDNELKTKNNLSRKKAFAKIFKNLKKDSNHIKKPKITINDIAISSDEKMSQEKIDSMFNSGKELIRKFNTKQDSTYHKRGVMTQFTSKEEGFTINSDGSQKEIKFFTGKKAADSIKLVANLKPIFISFLDKSVDYKEIDSLIKNQLNQKKIVLKTNFLHFKKDSLFYQSKKNESNTNFASVSSKSTFVKGGEVFKLQYSNPNFEALKRSSIGILLSFLLSLTVILSLFYLLKIINKQKELAIIKNDLISNITHEFKTPIATVSSAIEAIENFNVLDDKEKTKKYLAMSSIQLKKLHLMVEKLLETATLDSEDLLLKRENVDVVAMIHKIVLKHQMLKVNKEILFSTNVKPIYLNIDIFHFENSISNLIDNAIKYGGKNIEVNINTILNAVEISVADDGNGIEKNQQEKIFDKFYRVPKGNTHNVKGFGIGLYYCKKIIEKHGGNILLSSTKNNTTFKINMPNV